MKAKVRNMGTLEKKVIIEKWFRGKEGKTKTFTNYLQGRSFQIYWRSPQW